MNSEIEAQFLNINKNKIREKLKEIGAECVKPEVLMRRVVFALGEHERKPRFEARYIYSFCALYEGAFDVDSRELC